MERKDATSLVYEEVSILDTPALFTDWRIHKDTVPEGLHCYELRHTDEDWGIPCQLASGIMVNFYGSILTSTPFQLDPDGRLSLEYEDFFFSDKHRIGIEDFFRSHPPAERDIASLKVFERRDTGLFFSQDEAADNQNGCIGHLRGDFGSGRQFYTTWWPHQGDRLNGAALKEELQRVVD